MKNEHKLLLIAGYFIFVIAIEPFYRDKLYWSGIELMKNWSKYDDSTIRIFNLITVFGQAQFMMPLYLIILFFTPLSYSLTYLLVLCSSYYSVNILKFVYRNNRPYWDWNFISYDCSIDYGNPSGHALNSTSIYFSLLHIIFLKLNNLHRAPANDKTDTPEVKRESKSVISKLMMLLISILLILLLCLVCITRIYIKVHSINQIIYGITLGFGIYILFFQVFCLHEYKDTELQNLILEKQYFIQITVYSLIGIAIIVWSVLPDEESIRQIIFKLCPNSNFSNLDNQIFQAMVITAISGSAIGLYLFFKSYSNRNLQSKKDPQDIEVNKSDETIINFNMVSSKQKLKGILMLLSIFLLSMIPYGISYFLKNEKAQMLFVLPFSFFVNSVSIHYLVIRICLAAKWNKVDLGRVILV